VATATIYSPIIKVSGCDRRRRGVIAAATSPAPRRAALRRAAPSTCRLDAGGPDGSRRRPSRVLDMSITPTSTCRYISPSSLGKRKPTGHDQQRSTSDARPTPFRLKKYYAQLPGRNEYRATLSMSM